MPNEDISRTIAAYLREEIRINLTNGSIISIMMGLCFFTLIMLLELTGTSSGFMIPGIWTFICAAFSFALYLFAKNNRIVGIYQFVIALLFVSLPSLLYMISYFVLPYGTSSYLTGPASYLYFFIIVMTGFLFHPRISILSGIIAGLEYMVIYLLGMKHLQAIQTPDSLLLQDLTSAPVYAFKAMMMMFTGIIVGLLSRNTKKLIANILKEEREKQAIDRLFGQYVSNEIKDAIVKRNHGAGEKKHVAVLFADIRSFTSLSEIMPPELVVEQLNQYLEQMVRCISVHGGVVDKFIGDAVMATFGGVLDLDNSRESAVEAAWAMQEQVKALNKRWQAASLPEFVVGIGIHYGEVLQGSIGSEHRKEFTVIGDTVNTASRIESMTKAVRSPIVLSEEVYAGLNAKWQDQFHDAGQMELKGKAVKINIMAIRASRVFLLPQSVTE